MVRRLWRTSPELMATAALMLVVLAASAAGLLLDDRVITGAPAWLKPAKFAVSIAIYTVTLTWLFTLLPEWPRTRRIIGRLTAFTMLFEMAVIGFQAWRGTTSHFNVSTPFDAVLFASMGLAIVIQTMATGAVAVALWRHRFEDGALGWAVRFGMVITIVGASTGGLMTGPTKTQREAARARERVVLAGAHTVGAPDGGPGIAGTGWSTEHGDLRVPHFVGLHALQVLALALLLLKRAGVNRIASTRMMLVAGPSYFVLYAILLGGALRGVPLTGLDASTLLQLGAWAAATLLGLAWAMRRDLAVPHVAVV